MPNKTISKDTKVTLTLKQLTTIVADAVSTVLDKYINKGLLGNPEVAQLQEESEIASVLSNLQEQLSTLTAKVSGRKVSASYQINEQAEDYDNSSKYDRTKYSSKFSNQASSLMRGGMVGNTLTTNQTFGNQGIGVQDPLANNPQVNYAVNRKLEKAKSEVSTREEAAFLDIIAETPGFDAPIL